MDKIKRIQELIKILNQASDAYYNTDKPIMSDSDYDRLYDELVQLEKETNYILNDSPTQKVGYEVKTKLEKVEHSIPLKSLGKTKDVNEIHTFLKGKKAVAMLKGDGLTTEIIYENGLLDQGSTRGNGFLGEDITHNVRTYKSVPKKINFDGYLKIVGESVILDEDFKKINDKLSEEDKYSNSRNLVAGSVRQLNSKICAERNVLFMVFGLLECRDKVGNNIEFKTVHEQFDFLASLGLYMIYYTGISENDNVEEISKRIGSLQQLAKDNGIPIDGIVFKFDDIAYGKSLGETSHHPLNAVAYKFFNEEYETEYIRTEWQTSRTGLINPVGIFKPVNIDGAEIERATLHNIDYFKSLELGEGDIVCVIRSNEVIPKIVGNNTRSNTEAIPSECPVCGSKTEIKLMKTANVLICPNEECPSRKLAQFTHFVSRNAMNIEGLSESTLEKFIDAGFIKDFTDIYKLEKYKSEIIKMDGFGLKSYNKLIKAIENSKEIELYRLLFALGIENVGLSTSKELANFIDNDIIKLFRISFNELCQMKDCGEVTARSIGNYFNNDKNIDLIDRLIAYRYVVIKQEEKKDVDAIQENPFKGKKLYPTGTFESYKKDELKSVLEGLGAIITSGYAKTLDYLIVGNAKGSGKVDKAKADGVKVITETEFKNMIKGGV